MASWLTAGPTTPVLSLPALPVFCNALYPSAAAALAAPRGDLDLCFDQRSGYLWNRAFDPDLVAYNPAYENALHFSPRFRDYARELGERLVQRYDLRGRRIVEIGSGEGNFLALLCELGDNKGVGYDPSFDPQRSKVETSSRMEIVREYYPTDRPVDAALVVCQHVLEHVPDPVGLIEGVRRSMPASGDTAIYFEVPDATYMVEQLAVWDLIYEHHSYFAAPTLRAMFERAGFEVTDVDRSFGDQYLYLEARMAAPGTAPGGAAEPVVDAAELAKLGELVERFEDHVTRLVRTWAQRLDTLVADGPTAVWGAGSKGVTFLNLVAAGRSVTHVVDINPNKAGLYVPGTGQPVVMAEQAVAEGLRHVVAMNPLYVEEIRTRLAALGSDADVVAVST